MRPEQWAERHDGLIPTAIARRAGLSQDQVDHRRKSGRYRKVFRGVSAVTGSPPTWRQAVRAVSLAAGQEVWLSHLTAGRVLGAQLFFWGRFAYALLYTGGIAWLRTGAWFVSVIGMVLMFLQLI